MDRLSELLGIYSDTFSDNFPIFMVMGVSDDNIIKILEDSIKNEVPYEPEIIEGVLY